MSDQAQPVLTVRDLKKRFGGVQAVGGVSLSVQPGQTVSIIGPNGSGKTTLFNLISGVLHPDSGEVILDGRVTTGWPSERIAELGLARTFQNGRVFGNMSVRDNVLLGQYPRLKAARPFAGLRNTPLVRWVPLIAESVLALTQPPAVRREAAAARAEVEHQLARFGNRLLPRQDQLAYSLSYANRRRTEIARALAMQPRLLLLDEPTAGMNPTETAEVLDQINQLRADGFSIVLIEHKLDFVMALSDRVLVLDHGLVIAEGTPAEIQVNKRVIDAYLGRHQVKARQAPVDLQVAGPVEGAAPAGPLLELRDIEANYGHTRALSGISLQVGQGEIVCLLGGNASGKSTTMKVILGLLPASAGSVYLRGEDITSLSTARRIQQGLASVPEARRLFAEMTVEENLLMGAFLRRDQAAVQEDLERMFGLFPRLAERRKQLAGTMSGGEQQMVAMARALMSRPTLICMDEPTMGLAPVLVDHVLEMIATINQQGVSVFMVEQNAALALSIAHRGYVLRNGEIVIEGTAAGLLGNPAVQAAYLGQRVSA